MEENKTISRRKALGGLGIGLGVVVIPPLASAAPQHTAQNYLPEELEDPTTKYPKSPFEPQSGAMEEKLKKFGGDTPLGRPGQPAELASIYVQLASNSGSYATGQIYGSSGGKGQP
jgi:NAD(P)-dependent dehydrogenase (short-subunit alcohol dehydrogenase family)